MGSLRSADLNVVYEKVFRSQDYHLATNSNLGVNQLLNETEIRHLVEEMELAWQMLAEHQMTKAIFISRKSLPDDGS